MARPGPLPWERSWLAYAWMAPLFGRAISEYTHFPVNLIAAIALLALTMQHLALLDGVAISALLRPAKA